MSTIGTFYPDGGFEDVLREAEANAEFFPDPNLVQEFCTSLRQRFNADSRNAPLSQEENCSLRRLYNPSHHFRDFD